MSIFSALPDSAIEIIKRNEKYYSISKSGAQEIIRSNDIIEFLNNVDNSAFPIKKPFFKWDELVKYFYKSSIYPNLDVSNIASMSLVSFILSRRYVTSAKNTTNLYFIVVGSTGSGKDGPLKQLQKAFIELNINNDFTLAIPTAKRSLFEMMDSDNASFRKFLRIKEFGMILNQILLSGSIQRQLISEICNIWDASDSIYQNNQYVEGSGVQNSAKVIERPALTLIGDTVPELLYPLFKGKHNLEATGFINRFIVAQTGEKPLINFEPHAAIPKKFVEWHQIVSTRYSVSLNKYITINFTDCAKKAIQNIEVPNDYLWARHIEQVMKWSLAESLINDPRATEINSYHILCAEKKIRFYRDSFVKDLDKLESIKKTETEVYIKMYKVLKKIKRKDNYFRLKDVYKYSHIHKFEWLEMCPFLESAGVIKVDRSVSPHRHYLIK